MTEMFYKFMYHKSKTMEFGIEKNQIFNLPVAQPELLYLQT